jgi:hypothetical protein
LLLRTQQRRYRELKRRLLVNEEAVRRHVSRQQPVPAELLREGAELRQLLAETFPGAEDLVLPTPLGNILRAAEANPQSRHDLQSGALDWYRLIAVIPRRYRALIGNAKAITDFWANLCVLVLVVDCCYLAELAYTRRISYLVLLPVAVGLPLMATMAANAAARQWGTLVAAAFDVYLPTLTARLTPQETRVKSDWPALGQGASAKASVVQELEPQPEGAAENEFAAVMGRYQRAKAQRSGGDSLEQPEQRSAAG